MEIYGSFGVSGYLQNLLAAMGYWLDCGDLGGNDSG